MAGCGRPITVLEGDIAEKFLLLSNTHDGTSSVQIKFRPIRVVCQNTLTMALRGGPTIRVLHTKDIRERLRQAERMLNLVNTRFTELENAFRLMTNVSLNRERLDEYLRLVFPDPHDSQNNKALKRVQQDRQCALRLSVEGRDHEL